MAACRGWVQEKLKPALEQSIAKRFGTREGWQLEVDPDADDGQCLLFRYPSAFPAAVEIMGTMIRTMIMSVVAMTIVNQSSVVTPGSCPSLKSQVPSAPGAGSR